MVHYNLKVLGAVQGVFFRALAKSGAEKLNLVGFARNEDDGSVYIEVEGDEKNIMKFIDWCKIGPPAADVENVQVSKSSLKNFNIFEVY